MKKVLLFNSEISTDGISKFLSSIVDNISDDFSVDIMTYIIKKDLFFKNSNVTIHEIGTSKNIIKRIKKEKEIIKKGNYDIVHINGNYWSRVFDCIAAKMCNVKKIIIHSHNTGTGNNDKIKVFTHKLIKKVFDYVATDYYSCSTEASKWMFSNRIIKNNEYVIINNGINIDKYKFNLKTRTELRKEYNLQDKYIIGNIARFEYQKNHKYLIEIFKECKKQNDNAFLLLIGTGSLEAEIKKKVKELGIEKDILFLGNKEDAYKYYNIMDSFVLPSIYEGLGIVAIEAQTNGLYCTISSNITKEVKISDNIEFLDLSLLPKTWAIEILKNKSKNRKDAYKNTIENNFDIKNVVLKLEKLYYK